MLSFWSPPFSSKCGSRLPWLFPPHDLVLWTDGCVPFPFGKGSSGLLANCSLCGTEATLSFSAGLVCSSFFAEACAILQALYWSWQHQQVCHFSCIWLSLCPYHPILSFIFPSTTPISLADLAGTVILLLFYQTTMGSRTLVSPGERRDWWACRTGSATGALCNPL